MWRRSDCGRRGGRAGEVGEALLDGFPVWGESREFGALILVRVGACADELLLMGVMRVLDGGSGPGRTGGGWGYVARNVFSARFSPSMERIWAVPCGDGANCTTQLVMSCGVLYFRRYSVVSRFTLTQVRRSVEVTLSSRLVIETILNPKDYCSRAFANVYFSGPHCTRNSSTYVKRRLCRTRLGSERASTF